MPKSPPDMTLGPIRKSPPVMMPPPQAPRMPSTQTGTTPVFPTFPWAKYQGGAAVNHFEKPTPRDAAKKLKREKDEAEAREAAEKVEQRIK